MKTQDKEIGKLVLLKPKAILEKSEKLSQKDSLGLNDEDIQYQAKKF